MSSWYLEEGTLRWQENPRFSMFYWPPIIPNRKIPCLNRALLFAFTCWRLKTAGIFVWVNYLQWDGVFNYCSKTIIICVHIRGTVYTSNTLRSPVSRDFQWRVFRDRPVMLLATDRHLPNTDISLLWSFFKILILIYRSLSDIQMPL